ncbi:MAG: CocE/NonD family hydrolase [Burkholderiales bacterium]|nr:CocE/NonD family hydrolase [Burkholderiales bacterium]
MNESDKFVGHLVAGRPEVECRSDVMVSMRDGVRLATDIFYPARAGRRIAGQFPVILERTPYGKDQDSRSERNAAQPEPMSRAEVAAFFTGHGYVVVYQDCRGRHKSEGDFTKYLSDANDGHDTCAWIMSQDWCDGKIGTKGLSYAAHTQMAAACVKAPGLRAMVVDSGGFSNGYQSGIRQGGAYELKQAAWAVMFAAEHSKRGAAEGFDLTAEDLERWFKRMPWRRGDSPLTPTPEYEDFLFDQWERGTFDDYWRQPGIFAEGCYQDLKETAVTFISSWYDVYTRSAVENYLGMTRHGATPRLILGPWTHGNRWETFSGDVDFGPAAALEGNLARSFLDLRLRWFDRYLKGRDNGVDQEPRVRLFVMGGGSGRKNAQGRLDHGGRWRAASQWPVPGVAPHRMYMVAGGRLTPWAPEAHSSHAGFVFDPGDPVPTVGGSVVSRPPAILAGAYNQVQAPQFFGCKEPYLPLAERKDVLVFQSAPLPEDTEVTGSMEVTLWISSDAPDTDFTAKLIDVYPPSEDYPGGYAMNLTDGILRTRYRDSWEHPALMVPGQLHEIHISTFPTSNLFKRGHRIRVDISSSNFPKFDVNPNTGEPEAQAERSQKAANRVYMEASHASFVSLPIVKTPDRPQGPSSTNS